MDEIEKLILNTSSVEQQVILCFHMFTESLKKWRHIETLSRHTKDGYARMMKTIAEEYYLD